jgi:hypothetical protein
MKLNQITIPRAYIKKFGGNYTHAAVLSEIENIAKTYPSGELFPLAHDELANWLFLTVDQVRYSLRMIKKEVGGAVQTRVKKYNGTPTTHYSVDLGSLAAIKEASCQ